MNVTGFLNSARAEWVKFRTVRSTAYGIITLFVISVGLGALIDLAIAHHFHRFSLEQRLTFDPTSASFTGLVFGQFAAGVIGALYITNEYASNSIRVSLAAVPNRPRLILSKVAVMIPSLFVCGEAIMFLSFFIGQSEFKGQHIPSASLSQGGVLRAVLLAGVYVAILGCLGFAFGLLLRKTAAAIVVFVVLMFIAPLLIQALPSDIAGPISRFLPDHLGRGMISVNQASGVYPPWGCFAILVGYLVVLVGVGIYLMNTRDA